MEKKVNELALSLISVIKNWREAVKELNYPNYNEKERKKISQALSVWKEIRKYQRTEFSLSQIEKYQVLAHQVCQINPLIKVVVMIESLPTSVWRELLWQENIDFMSFESFLRRISKEQLQEIENNFLDFHKEKKIPRVMKKSLRKKVKVFFGAISFKKLEAEEYDYERRCSTKSAWAYNLLGLDFGFSLYPKGENNDQKITNKSFTRFLSVKEHINDFVVNQENGKYWQMYKTARSNYALFPKKEVKMRTHVCPGFWFTIIMHAWFWVVSPIAILSTAFNVWQFGLSWASLSSGVLALPMLVWLLFAGFRFTWQSIQAFFSVTNRLLKKVKSDSWWLRILKFIGRVILVFFKFILLLVILIVLINFSIKFFDFFLPLLGRLLSFFLYLTLLYFVIVTYYPVILWYIPSLKDRKLSYENTPKLFNYFFYASIFASAVVLLDTFVSKYIFNFFTMVFSSIWSWFSSNFLVGTWMLLATLFIILTVYLFNLFEKNEKKFASYIKYINFLASLFIIVTIGFILLYIAINGYINLLSFGHFALLLFSLAIVGIGVLFLMKAKVNDDNIFYREKAWKFMGYDGTDRTYINSLVSQKLFREIAEEEELFYSLSKFANSFFYLGIFRFKFLRICLSISIKEIEKLLDMRDSLKKSCNFEDDKYKIKLISLIINRNLTVSEATEYINKEKVLAQKKSEERLQKTKDIKKKINNFFILISQPFHWAWQRVYRFFVTLKDLWDFFNKRCPYVSRSKVLY